MANLVARDQAATLMAAGLDSDRIEAVTTWPLIEANSLRTLAELRLSQRNSAAALAASRARLRLSPGDAMAWNEHARWLLINRRHDSELTTSVSTALRLAPHSRQIRLQQALLGVQAYYRVEPALRDIWQRNLLAALEYDRRDFLVTVTRHELEFTTCALAHDVVPKWCDSLPWWRELCARKKLAPKRQRSCRMRGLL